MKRVTLILISILFLILDNTMLPFFSIGNAYPSLLFTFAIAYSIINGREEGVFIGVVSGLLQDIFFFWGFGVNALINMLLCYLAAILGESILKTKRIIPVISMAFIYIAKHVLIFVILYVLDIPIDLFRGLIIGIYDSILMLLIYKRVFKLSNKDFIKRSWRFK
ncbi:MAG: rod shape-determining protein MreD [Clostridium sp.]